MGRETQSDDVRREFWALFLDASVRKDGQVPGWRAWWESAWPRHRSIAEQYEMHAAAEVARGRDREAVLVECVTNAKRSIDHDPKPLDSDLSGE